MSPKFQLYEVELADELLVNVAVAPFTLLLNPAVGPVFTVIRLVCVVVLLPAELLATSVTVYVPGAL